jgi:hypothetical protein
MSRVSYQISALAALALGFSVTLGCTSSLETFTCQRNADCVSEGQVGGQCESSQFCSFADTSCGENGQRFGNYSGDLSNECVGGNEGQPDAATVEPEIDAAGPDAEPSVPDAGPGTPDADPTCAMLSLTVHDDSEANDFVRIRVDNEDAFECHPPIPVDEADTMILCEFCMPIGLEVELKADSGIRLETSTTDCSPTCMNDNSCKFTASVACSATFVFDVEVPPQTP